MDRDLERRVKKLENIAEQHTEKFQDIENKYEKRLTIAEIRGKNTEADVKEIKSDLKENNKNTKATLYSVLVTLVVMVLTFVLNKI